MAARDGTEGDVELLAEQREFYRADAEPFDRWLGSLLEEENDDEIAVRYQAGRALFSVVVERSAPLGRVLEIAAGTGRLAGLYVPHASSTVLLDSSSESLAIAAQHLAEQAPTVRFVEGDVFEWDADGQRFDTIVFSAWLHHVPHSRFDDFWRTVESLLAEGGRVIFDFPDPELPAPWDPQAPTEPTDDYGFYAPVDGISIRDHFGKRWRVVHNLWEPAELSARLAALGWTMTVLGPGLFGNVVWAEVTR